MCFFQSFEAVFQFSVLFFQFQKGLISFPKHYLASILIHQNADANNFVEAIKRVQWITHAII